MWIVWVMQGVIGASRRGGGKHYQVPEVDGAFAESQRAEMRMRWSVVLGVIEWAGRE